MALLFVELILASCKKESKNFNNPTSPKEAVVVEDGKLVFSKLSDFNALMQKAHEQESVGISQGSFVVQEIAQRIEVKTGEIYGLGKLNGEWRGISITKK